MSDKKPRCWVLENGGDRCVLVADHPGPHMGGYHTFESIPPTEEMARLIGTHCDQLEHALRERIAALAADNERLRAEVDSLRYAWSKDTERQQVMGDAASLRLDLASVTTDAAKECGRLRAEVEIAYRSRNEAQARANDAEREAAIDLRACEELSEARRESVVNLCALRDRLRTKLAAADDILGVADRYDSVAEIADALRAALADSEEE